MLDRISRAEHTIDMLTFVYWNDVLSESAIDRFPDQPQPGTSIIECVRGASETGWSDINTLFLTLLEHVRKRIRITTAYFVPDEELNGRLSAAARRGVEVEILLPGPRDDKRFVQLAGERSYEQLLRAGVRIWHYQPTMLHAKITTVDGLVANIGPANLNARSTELDEEITMVVFDPDVVRALDGDFDEALRRSREIVPGRWEDRSLRQRVEERVAGLLKHDM